VVVEAVEVLIYQNLVALAVLAVLVEAALVVQVRHLVRELLVRPTRAVVAVVAVVQTQDSVMAVQVVLVS
jgi:hypothetical protein